MEKDLEVIAADDFYVFFRNNLLGLIKDSELLDYISKMMVNFASAKKLSFFFDQRPDSVKLDDVWKNTDKHQAYDLFREFGDSCLFISGFYPQYVSKQKKSKLGIGYYMSTGQTSYNYAVSAGNQVKSAVPNIGTVSKLSTHFRSLAKSIFELKSRVDIEVVLMPQEVVKEISQTIYNGMHVSAYKMNERPLLRIVK